MKLTREVKVGPFILGGKKPVRVQSMCNTDTRDAEATVKQIKILENAGCEINRVAVPDMDAAVQRVRTVAAPANAMRLDRETPCAKTGVCANCKSPDRICSNYVAMGPQGERHRIKVLILEESLGY